jgi:two-component system NarL family sensor kinase
MVTRLPLGLVWATWLLILLLELATPPAVVVGILYVVPLLLGASQRTPAQAWRFLVICCASTMLNLLVPLPVHQHLAVVVVVVIDRLLVCLALVVTTTLLIHNQQLQARRMAQDVELARTQLRGDVIATLAHDLKTPVLGTLSSLSLLEGGAVVEAIRASQQRCLRLIDDLLQVFRAEQEGLQLQLQPCQLLTIAQEALRTVEPIARERQISLVLRQEPSGAMELLADASLLQRLLENLLLNALHNSLRGQRVWLQLSRQGTAWLIDVRDGGRGFAAEDLRRLFQRFARSGNSSAGVGLGLYLCRLICEAHGGTITASNDPAGGARVVVQLPHPAGSA